MEIKLDTSPHSNRKSYSASILYSFMTEEDAQIAFYA